MRNVTFLCQVLWSQRKKKSSPTPPKKPRQLHFFLTHLVHKIVKNAKNTFYKYRRARKESWKPSVMPTVSFFDNRLARNLNSPGNFSKHTHRRNNTRAISQVRRGRLHATPWNRSAAFYGCLKSGSNAARKVSDNNNIFKKRNNVIIYMHAYHMDE